MKKFVEFARKKKTEDSARYAANFKNNQKKYLWKNSFYKAYRRKDYATAEIIYLSREKYQLGISDVHVAYKLLKQSDHAHAVALLCSLLFIIFCFFGVIKCIS